MTRVNILSASAGSGKTFRLVLKYICDVLKKPECYRNILAVTFTNKATEEMKSRIINELHRLAENLPSDYLEEIKRETGYSDEKIRSQAIIARTQILHDYSRFSVLTIDSFFQRIIRAFINELSLDLDYNIELDTSMLLERSADELINSISEEDKKELKDQLTNFTTKRLEEGNKWDMRKDLCELGGELFKDGIAKHIGSNLNKQKLDEIIKKLNDKKEKVLNDIKALGEDGVQILTDNNLTANDFKGRNPSFITCFEKYKNGDLGAGPTDAIRNAVLDISKWYTQKADAKIKSVAEQLQDILGKICEKYDDNIYDINTIDLLNKNYRSYALLNDLHQSFKDVCKEENIMVLDKTKELLTEFIDEVNAPFIYEKVGNRYDHYMIDEFQDTSKREWRNIRPLLIEALSSNMDASVFIVGDIKQSIYRWRGGDWRLLNNDILEDLKLHNPTVEHLAVNRRSNENIVKFNNMFIRKVVDNDNNYVNDLINSEKDKGISTETYNKLENIISKAYTKCEQETFRAGEGIAEVGFFDSKVMDSPFIEAIKDAISRGYRYKDILILVRTSKKKEGKNEESDSEKVVKALYEYKDTLIKNNQPGFNILTSDSLKIDSCDMVKFIIAVMRLAINPYNNIERGIYNGYLNRSYGEAFTDEELQVLSKVAHLSALETFELIVKHFELEKNNKHIAYLQAIHEQILSFSSNHIADIQHYLAWWDERGHKETLSVEMTDDTIEITTIHKSKGLERDIVIIPYCKWGMTPSPSLNSIVWASANESNKDAAEIGLFPVTYGPTMKNSAFSEEYWREFVMSHVDGINLLYVAVTRAKKELYMYIPESSASRGYDNVSGLIKSAVESMDKVKLDENCASYKRYFFGNKAELHVPKEDTDKKSSFILNNYPTHSPKVNVHKHLERFTKEGSKPGTTACDKGIKMHKTFEGANTINDIYESIEQMVNNGYIKQTEAKKLRADIDKATDNKLVSEWFSGEWDVVKCEEEILCQGITHRPDRVMIKGDRVVVVDYKFGAVPNKDHHEQVKGYISALQNMGCYNTIEGYVWYVHLNKIKKSTQN